MTLTDITQRAREENNCQLLLDNIPYAQFIGLEYQKIGQEMLFKLPQNFNNLGNPILPALHGGVIGGFMEMSASIHLIMHMDIIALPKLIDFSLDYLRAGRHQDTFAECQVWRQGKRVANVAITAWQDARDKPIATARAHFLLKTA